ncbi:hypothetical protein IFR04_001595 [Cadophora malorum]|uniref:Uncharacterized protein n=1 Tax=Cadophora malorum TaxID=108018 RepID=A0A8H8BVJ2_9HELO|nr:hypothetical protein IFR04_001595 [Cadophora malorum]
MAKIDHTTQATFVATDPRSKTVFCCANQPAIVAHPNIRAENIKDQISSFIGKLATAESLFLLNKHTTDNLRASISTAKFVIEVERNVDEGFQCRYFILSRDKVIIEEHESPNSQATTIVPTSISNILVSRSNQSREATVDSSAATSYSATIVTPQKRKKLTVDEMFTPSPDTFTRTRPTFSKNFGDVTVEIIGQVVPETPQEDAYVEVHVKDLFGDQNPAAWHINNCFTLVGCRFHQPFVGESILKRVHVMKNIQRGKVWKEGEEPRVVTGNWLKGGHGPGWGV